MQKAAIVGAGLAGSLLALVLARKGIEVDVYEARGDMRAEDAPAGRSINLALSNRGIAALAEAGMDRYMLAEAVPMNGRLIHAPTGETRLMPYSGRKGEYINSISRAGLNIALINEAERKSGVTFHFEKAGTAADLDGPAVIFRDGSRAAADTIFAADGAGSAMRRWAESIDHPIAATSEFLAHGYKELHIPPGPDGTFLIERNALHIWPRHQFMMIALPNIDGSFTCTLFLAQKGDASFETLTDAHRVTSFFKEHFADAVPLMPTLVEDFFKNPTGELGTLRCRPWHLDGRMLLIGDAAHAMVPFYGQGMNCAFEDVRVLSSLIESSGPDWSAIFSRFETMRQVNADAIQTMAVENFYEMRDKVADPVFQRKRSLETLLEQTYDDYFSKYSLVTFREDVSYAEAMRRGGLQDELLMRLCSDEQAYAQLDPADVIQMIRDL